MSSFMANAGGGGDVIQEAMARRASPMQQQAPSAPSAQPMPMPPTGAQPSVMPPGMNAPAQAPMPNTSSASPGSYESKTILGALKSRLDTISKMQENGMMA